MDHTDQFWDPTGAGIVPDGVGKLVLLLSVSGQRSEQDIIWWDDAMAFRLE
jgi:hypothetical protein